MTLILAGRRALATIIAVGLYLVPQSDVVAQGEPGSYWGAVALGYGSFGDFCDEECPEREDAYTATLEFGVAIGEDWLLGVAVEAMTTSTVSAFGLEASSSVTSFFLGARSYPVSRLFLSAGVGRGSVEYELSSGGSSLSVSTPGVLGLLGIGYDFRLPTDADLSLTPFLSGRALRSSEEGWADYFHGGVGLTLRFGSG